MSNPVQNINNIAPVQEESKDKKPTDAVLADFEEGKRFLENGDTAQAAVTLHNALLGYEERDDENGIANASNQLGKACLKREEYETALKHFERAWEICEKLNDPASLIALLNQFAHVHIGLKQYNEAIGKCLDILGRYQSNNDPRGTVATLEWMANIYIEMDAKPKAADVYKTIASIHKNFKHEKIANGFLQKAEELEKAV